MPRAAELPKAVQDRIRALTRGDYKTLYAQLEKLFGATHANRIMARIIMGKPRGD